MGRRFSFRELLGGGVGFGRYLLAGGLLNVNLEVTKRCNARCNFCDYWREAATPELPDFVPVVKRLKPLSVSLTGGETLLRADLARIIGSLRRSFDFLVIGMVTNGALLTEDRGRELWEAGLDELSISLDYLDERHDRDRGLPGLSAHILEVAPRLQAAGCTVCFNTVIKRGNYWEIPRLAAFAADHGIKVSVSTYNCWRNGNERHMLAWEDLPGLGEMICALKELKGQCGNLVTSDYYLERIPEFFAQRAVPGCTAGMNWLQVTPQGFIKRCSDRPVRYHFSQWHAGLFGATDCRRCWYSCRGAAQEPWTVRRFLGLAREALG